MNADERRFLAGNSGFNLSSQFVDTTLEDFLEGFPTVSRALAVQALEEAKQLLLARA